MFPTAPILVWSAPLKQKQKVEKNNIRSTFTQKQKTKTSTFKKSFGLAKER
jgi:hypothetical protein